MAKEHAFWGLVRRALRDHCDLQRIENVVGPGTPDVNGVDRVSGREFWLELKSLERWPVRPDTVVFSRHDYTLDQCYWLSSRWRWSQNTWLALRVLRGVNGRQEIMLVPGSSARVIFNAPQRTWRTHAMSVTERFPTTVFLELLRHGQSE